MAESEDGRPPLSLLDRALGAHLGLAIGDALGATVEFMTPREIQATYGVHRQIVGGGWLKLRAGQVTDDTTMALALGNALVSSRGWDLHNVAGHFVNWMRAMPVDCGNTCRRGIRRYLLDGSLEAPFNEGDAGNGAAMRNLPVVLAFHCDRTRMLQCSHEQARLTHNHPLSDAGTLALAEMTASLLHGNDLQACRAIADALVARQPRFDYVRTPRRATGYIVDTVQTVLHYFFQAEDFADCLIKVVNRGDDADTTGALAGMLAGARWGMRGLPQNWLRRLETDTRHSIEVQVRQLLEIARHGAVSP